MEDWNPFTGNGGHGFESKNPLGQDLHSKDKLIYFVVASNAPSAHQGKIVLFWQLNKFYNVKD